MGLIRPLKGCWIQCARRLGAAWMAAVTRFFADGLAQKAEGFG